MTPSAQLAEVANLRAAWRMGFGAAPGRLASQRGFDLRVLDRGEPWRLAFRGRPRNPTALCTLEGALQQMLLPWPRNFNPPLTIVHLGRVLEDRDGTAALLKARAEELWEMGSPPPDADRLKWLRWWAQQAATTAECFAAGENADSSLVTYLAAEAMDRCIVAYCLAESLWAPLLPQFLALGGEPRYSQIVAVAGGLFCAESPESRVAPLTDALNLALAAVARRLQMGT